MTTFRSTSWRGHVAALSLLALAACGGGGGGGSNPDDRLAIDAGNRDTIARAAAAGVLALGATGAVPLTIDAAPTDRARVLGAGATGRPSWMMRVLSTLQAGTSSRAVALSATRVRPLEVIGPVSEDCAYGGSVTVTVDDRDNNGDASAGDVATFVFDACQDDETSTVDGSVTATVVTVSSDGSALSADFALDHLSAATSSHSLGLDGTVRIDFSNPGFGPESTLVVTASDDVTASVSLIHLGLSDTVTLRDGFRQTSVYDSSVAPVTGNVWDGRTTVTVAGTLHSTAAGGSVVLSTPTAFVSYGEDAYPREGALLLDGDASALRATALSTTEVLLELDANDDGAWESPTTVDWDWLV